jgi:7-carboxy-7-deazaguanine synthase
MNQVRQIIKGIPSFSKPLPIDEPYLHISECFMDTIQGEGINAGHPSVFLRLQYCTLACRWCDSMEVWRKGNPYTIKELIGLFWDKGVIQRLKSGHHLVITGGSPLYQQMPLLEFFKKLREAFGGNLPYIEIENECVLWPEDDLLTMTDCWNNSPKLASSGNRVAFHARSKYFPELLKHMSNLSNSWFKFVVTGEEDLHEIINNYLAKYLVRYDQIILMPEGASKEEIQKNQELVVQMAIANGFRYSPRLQVDIWDTATGV